jgi:hypothetical protein
MMNPTEIPTQVLQNRVKGTQSVKSELQKKPKIRGNDEKWQETLQTHVLKN